MQNKVLVTGGCGFIGSHLSEYLLKQNFEVTVFDRYNSNNHKGWLEKSKYNKDINFIFGDIRDYDSVTKATKDQNIVLHLAALIGIPYSYFSPLAYVKTNIEGTYNILESCKINNTENLIITSTSEVYGTAIYTPIDESHPLQAQSPYSASKISADHLSKSYHSSFGINLNIIRPFNTYGPRQSLRAIIPTILSQLVGDKKEIEVGSLEPIRDFTYVDDTCDAYLKLINTKTKFGEIFNIGNNKSISIEQLITQLFEITGIRKQIKINNDRIRPKDSEVQELKCNFDKFKNISKWKPSTNLKKGLELTYNWFLENNKDFKKYDYHI